MLQEPHCFVAKMLSEVFICEADPLRVDLLKASLSISNGILDEGILSIRGSSPSFGHSGRRLERSRPVAVYIWSSYERYPDAFSGAFYEINQERPPFAFGLLDFLSVSFFVYSASRSHPATHGVLASG